MAQPLHSFGEFHERSEAGEPANSPMHDIANLMTLEVGFPSVGLELLDSERQTMSRGIDVQDDRLHDLSLLQDLGGMFDALRPGQVRDMHQTVNAFFDLDKRAEVSHIPDSAFHHRS